MLVKKSDFWWFMQIKELLEFYVFLVVHYDKIFWENLVNEQNIIEMSFHFKVTKLIKILENKSNNIIKSVFHF